MNTSENALHESEKDDTESHLPKNTIDMEESADELFDDIEEPYIDPIADGFFI